MSEKKAILLYAHCASCAAQRPANQSQSEWARLDAGLTTTGLQIWCKRCRKEVAHFTPAGLQECLDAGPGCDCCPGGKHSN